jgi:hypothetical protein
MFAQKNKLKLSDENPFYVAAIESVLQENAILKLRKQLTLAQE